MRGAIENPLPVPVVSAPSIQVFSGASPVAWTDLDLSAVVGAYQGTVLLFVIMNDVGGSIWLRRNGVGNEVAQGSSAANLLAPIAGAYLVVECDAAGIIEWKTNLALNWILYVMRYWRGITP